MEELICTLSSNFNQNFVRGTYVSSMLMATTLTCLRLREGHGMVMTMQSKMEKSWEEDSPDLPQQKIDDLNAKMNTVQFWMRQLRQNFMNVFAKWILQRTGKPTMRSILSRANSSLRMLIIMNPQGTLDSTFREWRDCLNGWTEALEGILEEVSYLARRVGASPRRSAPLRYKRKGTPAHTLKGASSYL